MITPAVIRNLPVIRNCAGDSNIAALTCSARGWLICTRLYASEGALYPTSLTEGILYSASQTEGALYRPYAAHHKRNRSCCR